MNTNLFWFSILDVNLKNVKPSIKILEHMLLLKWTEKAGAVPSVPNACHPWWESSLLTCHQVQTLLQKPCTAQDVRFLLFLLAAKGENRNPKGLSFLALIVLSRSQSWRDFNPTYVNSQWFYKPGYMFSWILTMHECGLVSSQHLVS